MVHLIVLRERLGLATLNIVVAMKQIRIKPEYRGEMLHDLDGS